VASPETQMRQGRIGREALTEHPCLASLSPKTRKAISINRPNSKAAGACGGTNATSR